MLTGSRCERPLVAENLHAVHQLAYAIGFGADQLSERTVELWPFAFDQLGRASDTGKRVFDFMGEHRGESRDGARGAAMGQLTLDHLRHAPLLQHHQYAARCLGHRTAIEIDELRRIEAEGAEIDAILIDVCLVPLHLLDERDERAAERHHIGELAPAENRGAHLEEIFGCGVDVFDAKPIADQEQRMWKRIEQRFGWDRVG